jgi:SOS-response transcriptional repressor LexA
MAQNQELPEWALKILDLRKRLALSQTAFGSLLHYSAMAVSRWETGKQEPPAHCYILLGNMAGQPQCWEFWARAGLQRSDVAQMFPSTQPASQRGKLLDFDIVHAGSHAAQKRRKGVQKTQLAAIPLLNIHAGTLGQAGGPFTDLTSAAVEQVIAAPVTWCPNPARTNCLRVKGTSMSPYIEDDDIVAVDAAQTDPKALSGKIVVARHRKIGMVLARFISAQGVHLLESEKHEFAPVPVGKDRNWQIVGKVLWWIRKGP